MKKRGEKTYRPDKSVFVPLPPFPTDMLVEVTNACNHACVFCANQKMTRKKGSIDMLLLERLLREAYALGTQDVGFYSTGEPLVYKELDQAIRKAKEIGYRYIYITTNGALADLEKMKRMIGAGLDSVKFSINAASKEMYRKIHGRDHFDQVIKNLCQLRKFRDEAVPGFRIYSTFVITDENRDEVALAKKEIGPQCDEHLFFEEGNQGGYMSQGGKPSGVNLPCSLLFNRFHVTCEGYYTMCCVDYQNYLAVADLNEMSLQEAWCSPAAVEMRQKHLSRDIGGTLCENCVECKNEPVEPVLERLATRYDF